MINPTFKSQGALQIREQPPATQQASHGRSLDLNALVGEWGPPNEPLHFVGGDEDDEEPTLRELFAAVLRRLAKRFKRGPRR